MLGWRAVSMRVDPFSIEAGNYTVMPPRYYVTSRSVSASSSWPGLSRPSTPFFSDAPKTWMPGSSSAKTRFALLPGHERRERDLSAGRTDVEHVAVVARLDRNAKLPAGGGLGHHRRDG